MGYFNKPQQSAAELAPLTNDRIKSVLDAREANYGVDDDGDIGGYWDGHLFYFFILGSDKDFLQSRARWNRRVDVAHFAAIVEAANEWNATKLWPKVYLRTEESSVGVYAEHTVPYEHGLTDEQLDLHLAVAISTTGQFFDHLDESYPEQAAIAKAEYESE